MTETACPWALACSTKAPDVLAYVVTVHPWADGAVLSAAEAHEPRAGASSAAGEPYTAYSASSVETPRPVSGAVLSTNCSEAAAYTATTPGATTLGHDRMP